MKTLSLGLGLGILTAALVSAIAENPQPKPADQELRSARLDPQMYLFTEQHTTKVDSPHQELMITNAVEEDGKPTVVSMKSNCLRIFRVNAAVDDFTKQGGIYWRSGQTTGKLKLKTPGALVMVVRDGAGNVHWYSLMLDLRC